MPEPITMTLLAKLLAGGGAAAGSGIAPAPAGLSAIPELFKMGLGVNQAIKGRQLEKTRRPNYEIPGAMKTALKTAEGMARDTRLPGQSLIEQQIGSATASGQRRLNETGGGAAERMAGLVGLHTGQQQQLTNVGVQAAQHQTQDLMNLQNMLQNYAQEEQRKWQWDKQQPYLDAMEAARREKDASNQNIYGAAKGLAGAAASTIGTGQTQGTQSGAQPASSTPMAPAIKKMLSPPVGGPAVPQESGSPFNPALFDNNFMSQVPRAQNLPVPGVAAPGIMPTRSNFAPQMNSPSFWDMINKLNQINISGSPQYL